MDFDKGGGVGGASEVLLALLLLIDGVLDGLALGLVPLAQRVDFALHLRVQVGHALLQLVVAEELELPCKTNGAINYTSAPAVRAPGRSDCRLKGIAFQRVYLPLQCRHQVARDFPLLVIDNAL